MTKIHPRVTEIRENERIHEGEAQPVSLTVWNKSLLFNSKGYTVYDSNGNLLFRVDNYASNPTSEMILMDATGNDLLVLKRKLDDWVLCRIYKRLDRLPRTLDAGERDGYISFSTQQELKELPPTPTFESYPPRLQIESSNFLGGLVKEQGMSVAEDLPRELGFREVEKKKSIVIDDLYSPNNHASSSSSASQSFEGNMSAKLSDIHQMYSSPFNDNRLWSTEAVTAYLS